MLPFQSSFSFSFVKQQQFKQTLKWFGNKTCLALMWTSLSPCLSVYLSILVLVHRCFSLGAGCSCGGQQATPQEFWKDICFLLETNYDT